MACLDANLALDLVDGYVILERHGRGGMGDVYQAYDPDDAKALSAAKSFRVVRSRGKMPP